MMLFRYRRMRGSPAPLDVYRALYDGERYGFIYESLEARGSRGRYSFLGGRPGRILRSAGREIEIEENGCVVKKDGNPLDELRDLLRGGPQALPFATFPGGAVGYLGYDVVRFHAPLRPDSREGLGLPDTFLLFPDELIVVDHLDEVVHLLSYAGADRLERMAEAVRALDGRPEPPITVAPATEEARLEYRSNRSKEDFEDAVRRAQDHIRRGDIFQVVLSQRLEFELPARPLDLYAALRRTNPSPYMYYLNLDGLELAGSSPEVLVKLTGRRVVTRPLAGTRPRGATEEEDRELAAELLADEKERAEHVMLVDLARNDVGRDCIAGSVRVDDYLQIERYSRVMHLVSNVTARLRDDRDAVDLFRSCFPAGTVSGAPKVRAMQIIDELEPSRRGPYAGAIGYFSYLGDMDLCIAIRTLVCHAGRGYVQAGAGIVADSVPELEHRETLNKARGLLDSLALASRLETGTKATH